MLIFFFSMVHDNERPVYKSCLSLLFITISNTEDLHLGLGFDLVISSPSVTDMMYCYSVFASYPSLYQFYFFSSSSFLWRLITLPALEEHVSLLHLSLPSLGGKVAFTHEGDRKFLLSIKHYWPVFSQSIPDCANEV